MTDQKRNRQPAGVPTGGEFAHNAHDEAGTLSAVSPSTIDTEARVAELEADHAVALNKETAAWFAHEFMSLSEEGDESLVVSFGEEGYDDGSQRSFFVETGKEYAELGDSASDLVPESIREGEVSVIRDGDTFITRIEDYDSGETQEFAYDAAGLSADSIRADAERLTKERATLRDEAEKVALVAAFEQASDLTGSDSITFHVDSAELDGVNVGTLRLDGTSIAIAPTDETQVRAFGFYGQGVTQVSISRTADGYAIMRTHESQFNKNAKVTLDRVTPTSTERWSDPGLFWDEEQK